MTKEVESTWNFTFYSDGSASLQRRIRGKEDEHAFSNWQGGGSLNQDNELDYLRLEVYGPETWESYQQSLRELGNRSKGEDDGESN